MAARVDGGDAVVVSVEYRLHDVPGRIGFECGSTEVVVLYQRSPPLRSVITLCRDAMS
ncbi:MAG: hypothetical protein WB973_02355 [Thermoanaerobaculia bacterium]